MLGLSYLASPLLQERVATTLAITQNSEVALDEASSLRLPIFRTAWRMYVAHPVNGVGVRAFPMAYLDYADADDPHVLKHDGERGATHAHNIVLEVMADTGTIGLLGLLTAFFLAWRYWRVMPPESHLEAFPYALALALVLFPLNTHFAIYGTYVSSLVWFLAGLWGSAARRDSLP
jgi:O-antigen ligase